MGDDALSSTQRADIIAEALPFIQSLHGRTLVVKIGGQAVADAALKSGFARDVALLQLVGIHLVLVHGGGPNIPVFLDRVRPDVGADATTRDVIEMVLGELNQELVALINRHGGKAVGLSGLDGPLVQAVPLASGEDSGADHGRVSKVDPEIITLLQSRNFSPVIMPIAAGPDGEAIFVDADDVASRLAQALGAEKLVVMTDEPGILDDEGRPLADLSVAEALVLIGEGGLLTADQKVRLGAIVDALQSGVGSAHLTDARLPSALLLEILSSEGSGTLIHSRRKSHFGADTLKYFGDN
jgi:acetylglutamate kinase